MRVGLTYDVDPQRSLVGLAAARHVAASLASLGHQAVMIGSAADLIDKLAAGARFELVLNCASDQPAIPSILATYRIACTGSCPATMVVCRRLNVMKSLLRDRGVPTTDYWLVETLGDLPRVDATYPVTIAAVESSRESHGVVVTAAQELSKASCQLMSQFESPVIVQPQLMGKRIEVGLLGSGAAASVLMPQGLDSTTAKAVERTSQAAWRTVGGRDFGSMQLQCDNEGVPHVVSIDPAPGLCADGPLMQLAAQAGLSSTDVVARILQSTSQRVGLESHHSTPQPHLRRTSAVSSERTPT